MKKILATIIFSVVLLSMAVAQPAKGTKEYEKERKHWVDSVLNTLTIRQQAAQPYGKSCLSGSWPRTH